jgi:diguanylate cyclase (GGDEF)-like protein
MKSLWPTMQQSGISHRIGIVSLLSIAGALFLSILALTAVEYFSLRKSMLDDSRVEAQVLADNVAAAMLFADKKATNETLQTLHASKTLNRVAVFLPGGNLFAYSPTAPAAIDVIAQSRARDYLFSYRDLEIIVPIRYDDTLVGYLYLSKTLARLYRQLISYCTSAFGIGCVALLLAWLVVRRVQGAAVEAETKLHALAHIDSVSGLWNRNTFNEQLQLSVTRAQRGTEQVAVFLLDLDNFKAINDTFGHHGGDALLAGAAQRLLAVLRQEDVVCRLGGDEFAIILRDPFDHQKLIAVAEKIVRLFAEPFLIGGRELYVTCSLGISVYPQDVAACDDYDALVRNADTAMYQAKLHGKNNFQLFRTEMNDRIRSRALMESGLRRAIAQHELTLHYQPQFALDSLTLIGAEALLRWHSEELGSVSPADFIPVAEDCGLIVPIGEWVLQQACAQMAEWRRRGVNLPTLAVNLSAKQLRVPNLPRRILEIINSHGIAPGLLELELTESVLMENVQAYIEDFSWLQAHGVRLSVDDFGTGYSSMAYLKRLPLDKIKIDRAFIRDLPHSANDREIVAAMIAMSHSLGLTVMAEGVEQKNQADFLKQVGCDAVQGYYFGKPLPVDEFEILLIKQLSNDAAGSVI